MATNAKEDSDAPTLKLEGNWAERRETRTRSFQLKTTAANIRHKQTLAQKSSNDYEAFDKCWILSWPANVLSEPRIKNTRGMKQKRITVKNCSSLGFHKNGRKLSDLLQLPARALFQCFRTLFDLWIAPYSRIVNIHTRTPPHTRSLFRTQCACERVCVCVCACERVCVCETNTHLIGWK